MMVQERIKRDWAWKAFLLVALLAIVALAITACSPRIVEKIVKEVEYRDRVVHDTAEVEIIKEVERVVTRDTASHLENTYAKSDAAVSGGFLSHSLESIPQFIKVPVEVHVTDTLYKESTIVEKEVKVEKPLSWAQRLKMRAFWWLLAGVVALSIWTLRKIIF